MKILVISDIHGNKFGLEAALDVGKGCGAVVCLGDIVGYGAHPNECCEILRDRKAQCLAGNHDMAALGRLDVTWFNPVAKAAITWTGETLTEENRAWLGQLEPRGNWARQGFQAVHASLRQPLQEYISRPAIAAPTMELMTLPLCFYGHTHEADCYMSRGPVGTPVSVERRVLNDGGTIDLKTDVRYLVNPGSCGQPRDGNPKAKLAIYDVEAHRVQILAVDYDYFSACGAIMDAGLPAMLGDRLFVGR